MNSLYKNLILAECLSMVVFPPISLLIILFGIGFFLVKYRDGRRFVHLVVNFILCVVFSWQLYGFVNGFISSVFMPDNSNTVLAANQITGLSYFTVNLGVWFANLLVLAVVLINGWIASKLAKRGNAVMDSL